MRIFTLVSLILLLFAWHTSLAQTDPLLVDPILVRLKGRIINAADSSGIPYANIVNNRYRGGSITNNDGYFTLDVLNIDSLIVTSVGYEKKVIYIPHNYMGIEVITFTLNPVSYAVGEVEIKGERPSLDLGLGTGKPVEIPIELRGDAYNEKPPIISALFNPISYWQYHLSRREREKRDVREAMALTQNWEMHSQNYNKEMVMMLTGTSEAEADSFMVWFNAQNVLPYTSTEYEVRASIIYYYEMYLEQKK
ncbi:MAG: carboxypeptidase-like regulatory domain-containing protein [Mariniphaga sp.]|nr:carboxypeptidase-like regulatory domain-containing protein [Mariniphaga sp.]